MNPLDWSPLAWAKVGLLAVLIVGPYLYGRHQVQAKWDHENAFRAGQSAELAKRIVRTRLAWEKAVKYGDEEKARADAAVADAGDVARRLSGYRARRCAVPAAPAAAAGSGSPGAEPDDLESLERSHFEACAADAAAFDWLRSRYNALRDAQQ